MDSPSTSALLRSFPKDDFFKDMNRQEKGFYYEMHIQRLLKANNVDFSGNSSSYSEWTSNQAKDYDIRINLPNGKTMKVEWQTNFLGFCSTCIFAKFVFRLWLLFL